jgi:hypothetical protein
MATTAIKSPISKENNGYEGKGEDYEGYQKPEYSKEMKNAAAAMGTTAIKSPSIQGE